MKCVLGFLLLVMLVLYPVTAEQTITAINQSEYSLNSIDPNTVLENITQKISSEIEEIQKINQNTSTELSETGIFGKRATEILGNALDNVTYAHSALIISSNGTVTAASPLKYNGIIGKNLIYQPETRYVIEQKKPVVSNLFLLEEGFYGISVSEPIFSKDKDYLGYTDVTIRPEEFLRQIVIPETDPLGYEVMIIEKNGTTIFENNEQEIGVNVLTNTLYDTPVLKNLGISVVYNQSGTYNYTFWNKNWNEQVPKQIIWTTLNFDGQEWRVGVIRALKNSGNGACVSNNNQNSEITTDLNTSINDMTRFV